MPFISSVLRILEEDRITAVYESEAATRNLTYRFKPTITSLEKPARLLRESQHDIAFINISIHISEVQEMYLVQFAHQASRDFF